MGYNNRSEMHMNQAEGTVRTYLINARNGLELIYGKDFADANPDFLLKYVELCVLQYQADMLADAQAGRKPNKI